MTDEHDEGSTPETRAIAARLAREQLARIWQARFDAGETIHYGFWHIKRQPNREAFWFHDDWEPGDRRSGWEGTLLDALHAIAEYEAENDEDDDSQWLPEESGPQSIYDRTAEELANGDGLEPGDHGWRNE